MVQFLADNPWLYWLINSSGCIMFGYSLKRLHGIHILRAKIKTGKIKIMKMGDGRTVVIMERNVSVMG
jgi:hypothetical protein